MATCGSALPRRSSQLHLHVFGGSKGPACPACYARPCALAIRVVGSLTCDDGAKSMKITAMRAQGTPNSAFLGSYSSCLSERGRFRLPHDAGALTCMTTKRWEEMGPIRDGSKNRRLSHLVSRTTWREHYHQKEQRARFIRFQQSLGDETLQRVATMPVHLACTRTPLCIACSAKYRTSK
jgi:hypothetical protein